MSAQADSLLAALERRFDGIEARHGDAADCRALLDRVYRRTLRAIASRRKTARARRDFTALTFVEEAAAEQPRESRGRTELSAPSAAEAGKAAPSAAAPPQFAYPLAAALAYARSGWRVLPNHTPDAEGRCSCRNPACPTPGKHPRIKQWARRATTDEATISKWWERWPDANVGVATGVESGIVVLDVDPRHGGDVSLSALIEEHGEWPRTLEADTGGGGKHVVFTHSGVGFKNSASVLGEGLDVKTDGGQFIAAPSLHASGGAYCWAQLCAPAPMPDWMLAELTKPRPYAQPTDNWQPPVVTPDGPPIPEGHRNRKLFEICCALRGKGVGRNELLQAAHSINAARCDPSLGSEEVERIVVSALRYEPNQRVESE